MSKRLILFNLILMGACFYIGKTVYRDYMLFESVHQDQAAAVPGDEKLRDLLPRVPLYDPKSVIPLNQVNFLTVSEKNLFLESRNLTKDASTPASEAPPPLEPRPVLLGVTKVGNDSRAFLFQPKSAQGQKASRMVRLGDDVLGYRVSQITANKVELAFTAPSGTVSTQVLDLSDPSTRMMRSPVKTPIAENQVINIGARPQIPVNPTMNNPAANTPLRRNEFIDDQGRRIARTPFGDKVISGPEAGAGGVVGGSSAGAVSGSGGNRASSQTASPIQPQRVPGRPYP